MLYLKLLNTKDDVIVEVADRHADRVRAAIDKIDRVTKFRPGNMFNELFSVPATVKVNDTINKECKLWFTTKWSTRGYRDVECYAMRLERDISFSTPPRLFCCGRENSINIDKRKLIVVPVNDGGFLYKVNMKGGSQCGV